MFHLNSWIDPDDPVQMTFFGAKIYWTSSDLDNALTDIADDRERAIFFSVSAKTVLAPYDGGFDVISLDTQKILRLEAKFSDWMSNRPDKL